MMSDDSKTAALTKAIEDFLRAVGKSPGTYPELLETPVRAASMWLDELLDGYDWDPKEILSTGSEVSGSRDMVLVKDLFFHSICPHHLLPFHGIAHVAYIPSTRAVGLSKIARLVDCFAHRLIIQEELGQQVVQALVDHLGAEGAACMLDTEQLCMVIRGVRRPGSRAVTTSYAGSMVTHASFRDEFLTALGRRD
jgi:GTP cyclohydrolase IA